MQNKNQAQLQEFFNNLQLIQTTTPEKVQEVLNDIRNYYQKINDPTVIGFAFLRFSDIILRLKKVNQSVRWLIDQSICDIITKSAQSQFKIGS